MFFRQILLKTLSHFSVKGKFFVKGMDTVYKMFTIRS